MKIKTTRTTNGKENRLTPHGMMVLWLFVAFLAVGCGKKEDTKPLEKEPETSLTIEQIKERLDPLTFVATFTKADHLKLYDGVDFYEIAFRDAASKPYALFILRVDMKRDDLTLKTLTPFNKPAFGIQPLLAMSQLISTPAEKVVASVNGDFFDWEPVSGRPRGPVVQNGQILNENFFTPPGESPAAYNFFGLRKDGTVTIGTRGIFVTQKNDFQEVIGGRERVVQRGTFSSHWDKAIEPRTLLGYTQDNVIYFVAVDGRQPGYSIGFTNDEGGRLLHALGAVETLNLDGGGSTTMVIEDPASKKLQIKNTYSGSVPRAVANGIAIVKKSN